MGKRKFIPLNERTSYHRLEDVIGCKWSSAVVAAIAEGVKRPGELERYIPGISTKVLNERLRKLMVFGMIRRTEYPGLPARVDYDLTRDGHKLAGILVQLKSFNDEREKP
ncbi:MAG TPA: helix-turn-helix domain-containing protein [Kiritimatiellia bacterium]|nr:helix-turn-helix domain-containing protein [Kiritimatiellia bacterium]HMP35064.1 helix-turn-helix domain-containing protein [Kiritimatiellia bacterium]